MEKVNSPETSCLPPGTQVGPWRLVARRGQGSYGAVYRAIRVGREEEGPVALKLALSPNAARFAREVALLSRVHHPAVPRLVDSGHWWHPEGACYPYVVMQWVEGSSLYEWADRHVPSSRTVLHWLAQLAGALEATHAAGAVHRDVKGDNVLVRHADGCLFLTDFGSGHYHGASTLTGDALPPGTPAYRPPEAWQPLPPSGAVARHSPELTEALEDAARRVGPEAATPLWAQAAPWLAQGRASPEPAPVPPPAPPSPLAPSRSWPSSWPSWPLTLAVTLALVLGDGSGQWVPATPLAKDGGSTAVADAAFQASLQPSPARESSQHLARKVPPKPLPGQAVPEANGRCRDDFEVPINGGCWVRLQVKDMSRCNPERYFEYQGGCYQPIFILTRPPVSSPATDTAQP